MVECRCDTTGTEERGATPLLLSYRNYSICGNKGYVKPHEVSREFLCKCPKKQAHT
jgi:hypothetical protein